MTPIVKELRNAAKCAPLWKAIFEAAADEIERLQEDNNKIRGRMHDQWINQNKVKADAVREEIGYIKSNRPHWHLSVEYEMMMDRLVKLERGEI